jgi:hypothetical protein
VSSAAQVFPQWFERAFLITIQQQKGVTTSLSSQQSPGLRVTFEVTTRFNVPYWPADIVIYNANPATQALLTSGGIAPDQQTAALGQMQSNPLQPASLGDGVMISAGYATGANGPFQPSANQIYRGNVFQAIWTRENVVDWKVRLRCLFGYVTDALNFGNFSISGAHTAHQTVTQLSKQCGIPVAEMDEAATGVLGQSKLSRAEACYDRPYAKLGQIAADHNLQLWFDSDGSHWRSFNASPLPTPAYAYVPPNLSNLPKITAPTILRTTLLGVPEYTQTGIVFRILLDAQPRIGQVIQVPTTVAANPYAFQYGNLSAVPNQFGIYIIAGIRHIGDTRGHGNDWVTEITGVTFDFFPKFLANSPQTPNVSGG